MATIITPLVASKPNLVYVLADDLGFVDVKAFSPTSLIDTPSISALASQGMAFTKAHSGSAVCTPTRYGILTGRYCWRTLANNVVEGGGPNLIAEGRPTIATFLKDQGYTTAIIGTLREM
jgi:arylsulfatase A-like enzyme